MISPANLCTGLSLLGAFCSIIFSLESYYTLSAWAILFSVLLDGIDGQIARLNNKATDLGRELDSLVDVVAFGVAPSVLGYSYVYMEFHLLASVGLFGYLLASVVRLAYYNVIPKGEAVGHFRGLPTTAGGGLVASFILVHRRFMGMPWHPLFLGMIVLLALLMVSRIAYPDLKSLLTLFMANRPLRLGILGACILVCAAVSLYAGFFVPEAIFLSLFLMYLLFAPFVVKSSCAAQQ
jgi:CDP-diacylglycerol---serine O-phosphatidyltransferase